VATVWKYAIQVIGILLLVLAVLESAERIAALVERTGKRLRARPFSTILSLLAASALHYKGLRQLR